MATDYPDWGALAALQDFITNLDLASSTLQATASQIADEIQTTGIPLLGQPSQLYSAVNVSVPAATSGQVIDNNSSAAVQAMGDYLSYDVQIQAKSESATTWPFMTIALNWYGDSAATILLYQETWVLPCWSTGSMVVIGSGPVRGGYLQVTATNEDPSDAQLISRLYLYGNSRPAPEPKSDWRSVGTEYGVPEYLSTSAGASTDDVLGVFTGSIPASSVTKLLCNLYNGFAFVTLEFSGTSPAFTYQPLIYITGTQALTQVGGPVSHTAAVTDQQNWATPRSPLIIHISNTSASNSLTYAVTAIAQHQD